MDRNSCDYSCDRSCLPSRDVTTIDATGGASRVATNSCVLRRAGVDDTSGR